MYRGTSEPADFYKVIFTGSQGQQEQKVSAVMLGEEAWGVAVFLFIPIHHISIVVYSNMIFNIALT